MTNAIRTLPVEDVVFSLKTFAAAMLAYWIAIRFGLRNPYWAVGTVYIIAHPLSGSVTSKAIYRLAGTFLGAVMTVVLVPNLVAAPVLLSLVIALWCGLCLFISMLDRTPRSYVFMLGGYTVALTGFTLVDAPQTSFDVAIARVEEIAIGIICAAIIGRAVLPRRAGPILARRVEGWLNNAASLTRDVLAGNGGTTEALRERHKLAADAVDLRSFTTHVGYEEAEGRALTGRMEVLQQRMVALLPLLSEIEGILSALRRNDVDENHSSLLERIARWTAASDNEAFAQTDALLGEIAREHDRLERRPITWSGLLALRLNKRQRDLVEVWQDCRTLRTDMTTGGAHGLSRVLSVGYRRPASLHTDYGMAILSAMAAVLAILITCAFWISTGWSNGGGAVQMVSILCCVLATLDDARPALRKVLQLVLMAIGAAFVYQFAILPALDGFFPLVAALGLFLVPVGILLATPARWLIGFQLSVNLIYMLTLHDRASSDFAAFANASLATLFGIFIAMMTLGTVRAVGAETSASRLLRAGWEAVIDAATGSRRVDPDAILQPMLDRLGLLVPRLAALPAGSVLMGSDILRDLRVGLDVLKIQRNKAGLSALERSAVDDLLTRLAEHYRARQRRTPTAMEPLLASLDAALRSVLLATGAAPRRVRDAVVGLRGALSPESEPPHLAVAKEGAAA
ncbi:FUSC family protein [Bosea thiooxidans]|nr:FUSC family protein [Bosea sp. (in: a-proteobacteria)]